MKIINAEDYGVGPDNPDNSKALRAAMDALLEFGGGGLRLPSSVPLRIKSPIEIDNRIKLLPDERHTDDPEGGKS